LTQKMIKERLEWCRQHEHWTLEDWKNVIWTDETSVVLLHRRGGYRLWRKADEAMVRSCIRERWKGYSEFMFWGSFSYDKKGPCVCWKPETKQEYEASLKAISVLNEGLEPTAKAEWELNTAMARTGLRNKPGRPPQWKWNRKNGKLVREGGKGIDWWRYQQVVLIPKLIPFAKECMIERPNTIVQEDKAPAHAHPAQAAIYSREHVAKMFWCGNSPDLAAIEPCWFWMKRRTTRKGAPKSRSEAIQSWEKTWKELPQSQIQAWIERIMVHVQKVIELEGDNNYKEGRSLQRERRR